MAGVDIKNGSIEDPEGQVYAIVSMLMVAALQVLAERLLPAPGSAERLDAIKSLTGDLITILKNQPIAGFDPAIEKAAIERAMMMLQVGLAALSIDGIKKKDT